MSVQLDAQPDHIIYYRLRLYFSGGGLFGRALASVSSEAISENAPSDRVEADRSLPPPAYEHGRKEGEGEGKNRASFLVFYHL